MIKWIPDTCECEIFVSNDWQEGVFLKRCNNHVNINFSDFLTEHQNINKTTPREQLKTVKENLKSSTTVIVDYSS